MSTSLATTIEVLQCRLDDCKTSKDPRELKSLKADADKAMFTFFKPSANGETALGPELAATKKTLLSIIAKCDQQSASWSRTMGDVNRQFGGSDSGTYEGPNFGWPGGPQNSRQGSPLSLRAALSHATEEQREEVKALANYMTGRREIYAAANLTPSGDGGVLIPSFVQMILERNYAAFAPVVNNCRLFPTDTGAPEVFPVISDTESAVQLDASAATGADSTVSGDTPPTALTGPTLRAYKISSNPVLVPRELSTDSDVDFIQEVIGALSARIIRFENQRFTRGTGTSQAQGFLYACSNFEGFDTLDLDVALDLAYSVPPLYRPNGIYMASDTTIKYLRKLKTGISGDKRQLWAFEDANATLGTPATLHGYRIVANNDMADVHPDGSFSGGLNSPLAFGDFGRFVVRQAERNIPWIWNYGVPARDGRAVILFRRTDSKLLVNEAIAKLNPSGS